MQISTNDSDLDARGIARFTAGGSLTQDWQIARLLADGSLDPGFADSGVLILHWFAGTADICQDILLQKMAKSFASACHVVQASH